MSNRQTYHQVSTDEHDASGDEAGAAPRDGDGDRRGTTTAENGGNKHIEADGSPTEPADLGPKYSDDTISKHKRNVFLILLLMLIAVVVIIVLLATQTNALNNYEPDIDVDGPTTNTTFAPLRIPTIAPNTPLPTEIIDDTDEPTPEPTNAPLSTAPTTPTTPTTDTTPTSPTPTETEDPTATTTDEPTTTTATETTIGPTTSHGPTPFNTIDPFPQPTNVPISARPTSAPSTRPTVTTSLPPTSATPSVSPTTPTVTPTTDPIVRPCTGLFIEQSGNTIHCQGFVLTFPENAFADSWLDILVTNMDKHDLEVWDESTIADNAYPIDNMTDNQYVFRVQHPPLETENISYTFTLPIPQTVLDLCPDDYGFEAFNYNEQAESALITWPLIVLKDSRYNATGNTLTVEMYPDAFINNQSKFIMSCTPGKRDSSNRRRLTNHETVGDCKADPIYPPLSGEPRIIHRAFNIRKHVGVDYVVDDEPILAVSDGTVVKSGNSSIYGPRIIIKHTAGGASVYKHIRDCLKEKDDVVAAGDVIGHSYSASHFHLEYIPDGIKYGIKSRVDPEACMIVQATPTQDPAMSGWPTHAPQDAVITDVPTRYPPPSTTMPPSNGWTTGLPTNRPTISLRPTLDPSHPTPIIHSPTVAVPTDSAPTNTWESPTNAAETRWPSAYPTEDYTPSPTVWDNARNDYYRKGKEGRKGKKHGSKHKKWNDDNTKYNDDASRDKGWSSYGGRKKKKGRGRK